MSSRRGEKVPKLALVYFYDDQTTAIIQSRKVRCPETNEPLCTIPELKSDVMVFYDGKKYKAILISLDDSVDNLNKRDQQFISDPANVTLFPKLPEVEYKEVAEKRPAPTTLASCGKRKKNEKPVDNSEINEYEKLQELLANQKEKQDALREKRKKQLVESEKPQVLSQLKDELRPLVKKELRNELRDEVREELTKQIKAQIREELRNELKGEVREELTQQIKANIRKELTQQLRDEIRAELQANNSNLVSTSVQCISCPDNINNESRNILNELKVQVSKLETISSNLILKTSQSEETEQILSNDSSSFSQIIRYLEDDNDLSCKDTEPKDSVNSISLSSDSGNIHFSPSHTDSLTLLGTQSPTSSLNSCENIPLGNMSYPLTPRCNNLRTSTIPISSPSYTTSHQLNYNLAIQQRLQVDCVMNTKKDMFECARALLDTLFTPEEMVGANVQGTSGKRQLDQDKIFYLRTRLAGSFPEIHKKDVWNKVVTNLNTKLRGKKRTALKGLQFSN